MTDPIKQAIEALEKRPVAWQVKDYADGWLTFTDEDAAQQAADESGAMLRGLYPRAALSAPSGKPSLAQVDVEALKLEITDALSERYMGKQHRGK